MPLRKQGTIIPFAAIAATLTVAALPASASALSFGSWGATPTPTPVATPAPTPTPAPAAAATPAPTPAPATTGCTPVPTRTAFAKYGDNAQYFLAPGGDFENTTGWKFTSGAKVVSGNENLGVAGGSKSLQLPIGGTATSPAFCVDASLPTFRFASKLSSLDGGYAAIVIYRDAVGKVTNAQFTSSADGTYWNGASGWNPSAVSPLATKIPLSPGGTASVQLMFVGTMKAYGIFVGAKAYVDSVMVDPYRRG
jgi:hypothetical protein